MASSEAQLSGHPPKMRLAETGTPECRRDKDMTFGLTAQTVGVKKTTERPILFRMGAVVLVAADQRFEKAQAPRSGRKPNVENMATRQLCQMILASVPVALAAGCAQSSPSAPPSAHLAAGVSVPEDYKGLQTFTGPEGMQLQVPVKECAAHSQNCARIETVGAH